MPTENYGKNIKQTEGNKNTILKFQKQKAIHLIFTSYFQICKP